MEITLNVLQRNRLVEYLLKCPAVSHQESRERLLQDWSAYTGKVYNAPRNGQALIDVTSLVDFCGIYDDGLKVLIQLVQHYEQDSLPCRKVVDYLREIAPGFDLPGGEPEARSAAPAPATQPEAPARKRWEGSPFPGLRSFKKADAPIFFGREPETEALVRQMAASRFVAVVGASGSGKSSLVAAGLLPQLEANAIPCPERGTGSKDWRVVQFKPGQAGHPFAALFDGIVNTFGVLHPSPSKLLQTGRTFVEDVLADPATAGDTLVGALEAVKAPEGAEVLLFIDQFEELFTLAEPEAATPFARMLSLLAAHPRLRVVLTLRHDFVPKAIEIPELAELLNQGTMYLSAPTTPGLAQMVKRPAKYAGLEFEEGLPEQILLDTGSGAGALALMAYCLDELYKIAEKRGDRRLQFADYRALGGVAGAVGKRANEVFERLTGSKEAKMQLLGQVFRELVEVDESGTATRRRVPLACFEGEKLALVQAFTGARLLVIDREKADGADRAEVALVEVAHEILFKSWGRLRDWIGGAQEDLILLRQVRHGAADWFKHGRPEYLRWPQERLALVYAMRERQQPELSETERDFIEPEQTRLLRELENIRTTHVRRRDIGDRLSVIGDTRRGVGVGPDGTPAIEWLPVAPGGKIKIEKQTHSVEPFYIAKYLVTYAQYEAFVRAGDGYENLEWWQNFPEKYRRQKLVEQRTKSWNNPRDNVSWYQSVAFTRWLSYRLRGRALPDPGRRGGQKLIIGENAEARLPLEWEWQWAAQGGREQRKYPWGEWREGYANTSEAGLSRAVAVGLYPQGVAVCGALDMAGNLWEWCLNKYCKDRNSRVLRGGSFSLNSNDAACACRNYHGPVNVVNYRGFRVVVASPMRASEL